MLAREFDPVGQSRYEMHFSNQGGHQRAEVPIFGYTPCLVAILPSLFLQSKDALYSL